MSNGRLLAMLAVLLFCGVFTYVIMKDKPQRGAGDEPGATGGGTGVPNDDQPDVLTAPKSKPLFDGWGKPAVAIILTGEMHGYVEPCGCSLDQLGGLSRRADLMRQIEGRNWPVTAFDVGGLVNNPARQQGKFKFEMAAKSLIDMHYAGVAVGVEELQLSFDFLARPRELPFLASNLVLFGDANVDGAPLAHRVIESGGVKIGVTAVFGPSLKGEVVPGVEDGAPQDFEVLDPVESLKKALAALEAEKPDLLILLSHAKYEETKKLAEEFPQFDIIVTAGGVEDPDPKPKILGDKTLLVAPGQKTKHVPVIGYFPDDASRRLKFELVDLDERRFQDTPKIVDHMRYFQDLLKERNLVASEPAIDNPRPAPTLDPNPYVGVKVCGECHKSALEVWETSKHANATEALKTGHPGQDKPFINRMFDPECICCHVTGWDPKKIIRYNSGYVDEQSSAHLTGQQCENCHGPGGRHTELEREFAKNHELTDDVAAWRKFHRLNHKTAFDLCVKCHDTDNDPKFGSATFDEYWEQIAHPGRD